MPHLNKQEEKCEEMNKTKPVQIIQVIRTTLDVRGKGTEDNPYRTVEQFWSPDGELLAENDPVKQ